MFGFGPFLLLLLIGGLAGGEILAQLLVRAGRPEAGRVLRLVMLAGVAAYGGALLFASLTSRERILVRGETLRFCGFYLDCHLGIAVEDVEQLDQLGTLPAAGVYHLVTLRVSSNARRATLHLGRPEFRVLDQAGRRHAPSLHAEQALAAVAGDPGPVVRPVPAGGAYTIRLVFDLPRDAAGLRLLATDASGVDRLLEGLLIGDDDSLLHQPTTLALD